MVLRKSILSSYQFADGVSKVGTSGFFKLPGTIMTRISYVYVRYRTEHLRHRTLDARCRTQHHDRTCDIVRTVTVCYVRHRTQESIRCRTFVNIVGVHTTSQVGRTGDIVCPRKCMSYTISYVKKKIRHRRFVSSCRIRCRRFILYTMSQLLTVDIRCPMSYVMYDIVYFIRLVQNIRHSSCLHFVFNSFNSCLHFVFVSVRIRHLDSCRRTMSQVYLRCRIYLMQPTMSQVKTYDVVCVRHRTS